MPRTEFISTGYHVPERVVAIDECARSGRLERGDLLVLTAFGSGFTWGGAVVRW